MYMKKRRWSGLLACGLVTIAGCSLDLQDPNRPTEEEVFSGLDGWKTPSKWPPTRGSGSTRW